MNLPTIITELVNAQNQYESATYADCFSKTAVVVDEGNTYKGRTEIKEWIAEANEKFRGGNETYQIYRNRTYMYLDGRGFRLF